MKSDYIQKWKSTKAGAWIVLGTGVTLSAIGFGTSMGQPWDFSDNSSHKDPGFDLFKVGVVLAACSPSFSTSFFTDHAARGQHSYQSIVIPI